MCKRMFLQFIFSLFFTVSVLSEPVNAAGPWRGQVVEAGTGKPLEGVVVLAVWYRNLWLIGLHGHLGYGGSEEVVTDQAGRFVIASRKSWTLNPFVRLEGPSFLIFKSGYGRWRFEGFEKWGKDLNERREHLDRLWKQFERDGVVIELPPLKTREERLEYYRSIGYSGEIPKDEMKRLVSALESERAYLGFGK